MRQFGARLFGLAPEDADLAGALVIANGETHAAESGNSGAGSIGFGKLRVDDVAIPSADIVAVPSDISRSDLQKVFRDSGKSRIPIYEGTLDSAKDFVHVKDFALRHGFDDGNGEFSLEGMRRTLLFVPPSMPLTTLLSKMQAERKHMALVIDEYGGVDGLVTIEDVIERIVGNIEDEHDDSADAEMWFEIDKDSYAALGKVPLKVFEAETGISLTGHEDVDDEEIDTLGGLVAKLAGRVPARGEIVTHPEGVEFEILEGDPRRIDRLKVRKKRLTA